MKKRMPIFLVGALIVILFFYTGEVFAACSFSSASWNASNVVEGAVAGMIVSGKGNCRNENINFSIYEFDTGPLLPDDYIGSFVFPFGNGSWVSIFSDENGQEIVSEYYFIAKLINSPAITIQSVPPMLSVNRSFVSNPPDINGDGRVNVLDLSVIIFNQGRAVTPGGGYGHLDVNGDGRITWLDVEMVRNSFG